MEMKRAFVFIMVFILFFVSGCATTTKTISAGKVRITSMPSGAKVEANKNCAGETPCTLSLNVIEETTRKPVPFYREDSGPSEGQEILGKIILSPLIVACVFLDLLLGGGQLIFGEPHKEIKGINHAITVSKHGFETMTKVINSENPPKTLHFALTGGSINKNIRIASTPPEAKVYTDGGKFLGRAPLNAEIPFKYKEGKLQKTIIEIKKSGYKSVKREISTDETEVDVHLSKK